MAKLQRLREPLAVAFLAETFRRSMVPWEGLARIKRRKPRIAGHHRGSCQRWPRCACMVQGNGERDL